MGPKLDGLSWNMLLKWMDWKPPYSSLAKWIYPTRFSIAQGVFLDPSSPKYQDAASLVADFIRWCKP